MQPSVNFQTPKIDWNQLDYLQQEDLNRIEQNILYLFESWDEFNDEYIDTIQQFDGYTPSNFQPQNHTHDILNLTGTLPISRGGTGSVSFSNPGSLIKFDGNALVSSNIKESEVVKTLELLPVGIIQTGQDLLKNNLNVPNGSVYIQNDTKKIYQKTSSGWDIVGGGGQNQETGRIPKFLDNLGTLGNSLIYETNNRIGIKIQTPQQDLHVDGTIRQNGIQIGQDIFINQTSFSLPGGTIAGNLQVQGTVTMTGNIQYIQSEELLIQDPIIIIGGINPPSTNDFFDRGVQFRWHDGTSQKIGFFGFKNTTQKFIYIPDQNITGNVQSGAKGEIDQYIQWQNVLNKPSITLAGELSGQQVLDNTGQTINATVVGQTSSNLQNTIVRRDGSGNFSQGVITASLNGNQTTQSRLQVQRTIQISGQVTGSANFDGSSNITINTSVNHNHGTGTQNRIVKFSDQQGNLQNSNITDSGTDVLVSSPLRISHNQLVDGQLTSTSSVPTSETTWLTFNGNFRQTKVFGQVYNDYQEFREQKEQIPQGYVQIVDEDGKLKKCDKEKQKNQYIVSDTFGFALGSQCNALENNNQYQSTYQVPVQIQGRVLQYVEGIEKIKVGDLLVSTKRGTLRKLKWHEKLFLYKNMQQIVGIVDEIPKYETWYKVQVNGRVWVRVL